MRPPPARGDAHTAILWLSASSTAAPQAPEASTSGPATSAGRRAERRRSASEETCAGSGCVRLATARAIWLLKSIASIGTSQSSIGIETNAGPAGGRVA